MRARAKHLLAAMAILLSPWIAYSQLHLVNGTQVAFAGTVEKVDVNAGTITIQYPNGSTVLDIANFSKFKVNGRDVPVRGIVAGARCNGMGSRGGKDGHLVIMQMSAEGETSIANNAVKTFVIPKSALSDTKTNHPNDNHAMNTIKIASSHHPAAVVVLCTIPALLLLGLIWRHHRRAVRNHAASVAASHQTPRVQGPPYSPMILGALGFLSFVGGCFVAVNQENGAFAFGGMVVLVVLSLTASIIMQRYNLSLQQAALDAQQPALVSQQTAYVAQQTVSAAQTVASVGRQTSSPSQTRPAQQIMGNSAPSPSSQLAAIKSRAEKGDAQAQFELATLYDNGDLGLAQDHGQAFAWCQKAANQGFTEAEYWMGRKYLKGVGVTANKSNAMLWLKKAADQGYQPAKDELLKESA